MANNLDPNWKLKDRFFAISYRSILSAGMSVRIRSVNKVPNDVSRKYCQNYKYGKLWTTPTSNFQPIRLLDQDCCYKFTYLANSADPDQLASSEAN